MITEMPRVVAIPDLQHEVREARPRDKRGRVLAWAGGVLALVLVAGLAFLAVRQTGLLDDAREELAARAATVSKLRGQLAETTDAKDDLELESARMAGTLETCRDSAMLHGEYAGAVRRMFQAGAVGDRAGVHAAIRDLAKVARRADAAAQSCAEQTEPEVATV